MFETEMKSASESPENGKTYESHDSNIITVGSQRFRGRKVELQSSSFSWVVSGIHDTNLHADHDPTEDMTKILTGSGYSYTTAAEREIVRSCRRSRRRNAKRRFELLEGIDDNKSITFRTNRCP